MARLLLIILTAILFLTNFYISKYRNKTELQLVNNTSQRALIRSHNCPLPKGDLRKMKLFAAQQGAVLPRERKYSEKIKTLICYDIFNEIPRFPRSSCTSRSIITSHTSHQDHHVHHLHFYRSFNHDIYNSSLYRYVISYLWKITIKCRKKGRYEQLYEEKSHERTVHCSSGCVASDCVAFSYIEV